MNRDKKGIILIVSIIVMAIILVLVAAYFSNLFTEKRAADMERWSLQRTNLSESGGAHALSELNKRITATSDTTQNPPRLLGLKGRVEAESRTSIFKAYVTANNPLGFLHDFAYGQGEVQFTVAGGAATLAVSATNLYEDNRYRYNANLIVEPNGIPTNPSSDVYVFPYKYRIESQGQILNLIPAKTVVLHSGTFTVTVRRDNYAKYALFTSHHSTPSGGTVWFTQDTNFTGPVHTNGRFYFANNPSAHFTEEVTQHETKAGFYNDGWSRLINADSNPPNDVPTFDKGFQRGYDEITLPPSVSQTDLKKEAMGQTTDNFSNGINIPNNGTSLTGGIYIKGNNGQNSDNANIVMEAAAAGPVYTIKQWGDCPSGTNTVITKKISVDIAGNVTAVDTYTINRTQCLAQTLPVPVSSSYQGIPDGTTETGGVLIYSNDDIGTYDSSYGGISGVSQNGRSVATVQKDTKVTVASERNIAIKSDILYEEDPRTPGNEDSENLLGILSWGGDVIIGTTAPNDVTIDGVVMAPHGVFTVDNYDQGATRGTATLFGGAITDFYGPFGQFSGNTMTHGYGRNFVYDARMLEGQAPPYFPYMALFTSVVTPQKCFSTEKLIWEEK